MALLEEEPPPTLADLPLDVLELIGLSLAPADLGRLLCVCKGLRQSLLREDRLNLWQAHYKALYRHSTDAWNSEPSYYARLCRRGELDRYIRGVVRSGLASPLTQHSHLRLILGAGDDAIDVLRRDARDTSQDSLGQAYYSRVALSELVLERSKGRLLDAIGRTAHEGGPAGRADSGSGSEEDKEGGSAEEPEGEGTLPLLGLEFGAAVVAEAFTPEADEFAEDLGTWLDGVAAETRRRAGRETFDTVAQQRQCLDVLNDLMFGDRIDAGGEGEKDRGAEAGPSAAGPSTAVAGPASGAPLPSWLPSIPRGEGGLGLRGSGSARGSEGDYYDPSNSFLNKVLERRLGIPISLCVLHQSVAWRLGLPIHPAGLPTHFFNRFFPHMGHSRDELYIDCFEGRTMTREEVQTFLLESRGLPLRSLDGPIWTERTAPRQVFSRMLANLQNTFSRGNRLESLVVALELAHIVTPDDPGALLKLIQVRVLLEQVDAAEECLARHSAFLEGRGELRHVVTLLRQALMRAADSRTKICLTPRGRTSEVAVRMGQVVRHKGHRCLGVIVGWDTEVGSWSGVGHGPPFYKLLLDRSHGEPTVVTGEQIEPVPPPESPSDRATMPLRHRELGGYFDRWDAEGYRYVMNSFWRTLYVDD